jgi:hypothetical protein
LNDDAVRQGPKVAGGPGDDYNKEVAGMAIEAMRGVAGPAVGGNDKEVMAGQVTRTPANDYMVGGDHYRKCGGEQHWDRIWRLYGHGYFVGCITKYLERYKEKDGMKDLYKARHYLQKLIELEEAQARKEGSP